MGWVDAVLFVFFHAHMFFDLSQGLHKLSNDMGFVLLVATETQFCFGFGCRRACWPLVFYSDSGKMGHNMSSLSSSSLLVRRARKMEFCEDEGGQDLSLSRFMVVVSVQH